MLVNWDEMISRMHMQFSFFFSPATAASMVVVPVWIMKSRIPMYSVHYCTMYIRAACITVRVTNHAN